MRTAPVPPRMHVGDVLHVQGTLSAPATFAGVGLARVDAPKTIPIPELNRRRSYPVPGPYQMYWPAGFKTPIPVRLSGGAFSLDVPVSDGGAGREIVRIGRVNRDACRLAVPLVPE